MNPENIPRPQTEADYAACYSANLTESRDALDHALNRFRALKRAGQITEKPEGGFSFASPVAQQAWSDVVRHRSDLNHWHMRKVEAERRMRGEPQPDSRLPVEREPGEDDAA